MASAIFSRRILGAVAFAIVFGLACFALGRWQLSRYEEKDARADAVEANYARAAVPLASVLPTAQTALREDQVWTHVTATGRYAAGPPLLVRNRALGSAQGLEVLVPLRVEGGQVLLVDRGWVPNGASATEVPEIPAAPLGVVTVRGWLKPGEPDLDKELPAGQLASVDLGRAAGALGTPLYAAYLVLGEETTLGGTGAPQRPTALPAPTPDRGPHFAYAIQWWLTAMLGVGFVVLLYRSRPGAAAARETAKAARPPRPVKVRIWDEEDG